MRDINYEIERWKGRMKFVHNSFPAGQASEGLIKMDCPYSLSLRWRWKDRFHQLDAVPYGDLIVSTVEGDGDRNSRS